MFIELEDIIPDKIHAIYDCSFRRGMIQMFSMSFSQKSSLLQQKDVPIEELFKCSHCQKTFFHKKNLVRHMTVHTEEKPFKCSQCQKTFSQKRYLVGHMTIHTGVKPYECSHCQKTFTQKSHLLMHMSVHTGAKPYECSQCRKTFSRKSHLMQHMFVHTREKQYECSQCQKTFFWKGDLGRHIMVHTGVKPHECSQCQKTFSQKSNLMRHMKLHKEENPFTSDNFGEVYKADETCYTSFNSKHHCVKMLSCQQTSEDYFMSHPAVEKSGSLEAIKEEVGNCGESIIYINDNYSELTNIASKPFVKAEIDDMDIKEELSFL